MNITVRRCDFCKTDVRSDDLKFQEFGVLEDHLLNRWDMCHDCIAKAGR